MEDGRLPYYFFRTFHDYLYREVSPWFTQQHALQNAACPHVHRLPYYCIQQHGRTNQDGLVRLARDAISAIWETADLQTKQLIQHFNEQWGKSSRSNHRQSFEVDLL
jgi:hypothetical protein